MMMKSYKLTRDDPANGDASEQTSNKMIRH